MERHSLARYAWLSIAAAVITIGLKAAAYLLTGSVGLLSDALESVVNLVAAIVALAMLLIAARPADKNHAYGHSKAEYFASGVEGVLILVAAVSIGWAALQRLAAPEPLAQLGSGVAISTLASLVNFGVARVLLRAGKRHQSITLEADAHHLLTDVWTSAGVLLGIGLVSVTGWLVLDPIIALVVALNIVWSGVRLVRRSALGLMDTAIPESELRCVERVLDGYVAQGIEYHALRTRQSAARRFVSVHVLVPSEWSVAQGHCLVERLESDIRHALPATTVFTHLEPQDDPASFADIDLDRQELVEA